MPSNTWSVLGPFIGAGIGYYFRILVGRNSADRKEDRELINKIISDIENVEELAYEFYSLSVDNDQSKTLHLQINRLLKQIGGETYILSIRYEENSISKFQLKFKQKITFDDFESVNRQARDHADPLFDEISNCSRKLIGEIELAFHRKYRKNCKPLTQ